ncbi:hypothetical protein [Streptomyces monashensis]
MSEPVTDYIRFEHATRSSGEGRGHGVRPGRPGPPPPRRKIRVNAGR